MPATKLSIRGKQKSSKKSSGKERSSANEANQLNDIIEEGLFSSSDEYDEGDASVATILDGGRIASDLSSMSEQENRKRSFLKRNKQSPKIPGLTTQPSVDATVHASNREDDRKDRDDESLLLLTNITFSFASVETELDSIDNDYTLGLTKRQGAKKVTPSARTLSSPKKMSSPKPSKSSKSKSSSTRQLQSETVRIKEVERKKGVRETKRFETASLRCDSSTSSSDALGDDVDWNAGLLKPLTSPKAISSPKPISSPRPISSSKPISSHKPISSPKPKASSLAKSERGSPRPRTSPAKSTRGPSKSTKQVERSSGGRVTKLLERDLPPCSPSSSSDSSEDDYGVDVDWNAGLVKPMKQKSKQRLPYNYSSDSCESYNLDKTLLRIGRGM